MPFTIERTLAYLTAKWSLLYYLTILPSYDFITWRIDHSSGMMYSSSSR
jgi:hypothetical protein